MLRYLFSIIALAMALSAPVLAQQPSRALLGRVDDIRRVINGELDPGKIFSPSFLKVVPVSKVKDLSQQLTTSLGKCVRIEVAQMKGEHAASLTAYFERGMKAPVDMAIEPAPPHLVSGLYIRPPVPSGEGSETLDTIMSEFRKLRGKVSLALVRLPGRTPIASIDPDSALAIGSTFKLYILGELIARIGEGKMRWSDAVTLDSSRFVPGSLLGTWPHGAPVTLHTLATLMISRSDNTATDILLHHLGRERVEARMREMGNSVAEMNIPFLSTLEMFRLKSISSAATRIRFVGADEKGRREILSALDTVTVEFEGSAPLAIESIEWFASAHDLCSAMEWLRAAIERDATAGGILGVNPGLLFDESRWEYIGYKGGSEPGVLNLTFLLKSRKGEWYAFSAGWNDPHAALDEERFFGLVQRVLNVGPW